MAVEMYFKGDDAESVKVVNNLLLTFVGEIQRDPDRKVMGAYIAISFRGDELEVTNLADVPRLLRQMATKINDKIQQLKAGSKEETADGGLIME